MKWFQRRNTSPAKEVVTPVLAAQMPSSAEFALAPQQPEYMVHYPFEATRDARVAVIEERLLDYFLPIGKASVERDKLIRQDLVQTNNFSLWLNDAPKDDYPWDYRKQPFADEFGELWRNNAELIAAMNNVQRQHDALMQEFWETAQRGESTTALKAQLSNCENSLLRQRTTIFRNFAPALISAGYDPFDLCI